MSTDPDRPTATVRPSSKDIRGFEQLAAASRSRVATDAQTWRNGYAMLAGGLGALLGLIGNQLDVGTSTGWRIALSICFGGALLATGIALVLAVIVEGGLRSSRINLRETVTRFGSLEAYHVQQAATAYSRLDQSKYCAVAGALLGFVGLILTLWLPGG